MACGGRRIVGAKVPSAAEQVFPGVFLGFTATDFSEQAISDGEEVQRSAESQCMSHKGHAQDPTMGIICVNNRTTQSIAVHALSKVIYVECEGQQLYDHPWELDSKACLQCGAAGKTYDSLYVGFAPISVLVLIFTIVYLHPCNDRDDNSRIMN